MMKRAIFGAVATLLALTAPATAEAQHWNHGWHRWHEHVIYRPGWYGPVWYGHPGPHYGWYRWHTRWYRECGWTRASYGRRVWRCF